ncbi:MAG: hypothetical protein ACFFBH_16580 [Promethearchaeota archaeon]
MIRQYFIENYNSKTNEYELGRQEIKSLSFEDFKALLKKVPVNSPIPDLPICFINSDSIIKRKVENQNPEKHYWHIRYRAHKKIFLKVPEITLEIEDITEDNLLRTYWDDLKFLEKIKSALKISSLFFYPLLTIASYVIILLWYYNSLNLFFLILWSWLVGLCLFDIAICIYELRENVTNNSSFGEFSIPILSNFKIYDLSQLFIRATESYGAFMFLLSVLITPELRITFFGLKMITYFILIVILTIFFITTCYLILHRYLKNRKEKRNLLHQLNNYNQKVSNWNLRQYYLKFIIELRNTPIVSIGFFSKILMILTFFLASVPPIVDFYL